MKRILSLTTFWCVCCVALLAVGGAGAGDCKPDKSNRGGSGAGIFTNGNGAGNNKVCICHIPPGNPGNAHTICIGAPAVRAHLAHGDSPEPCEARCGGTTGLTCDDDQFCKHRPGVCDEGAEGRCVDLPLTCPAVFEPVCGCDGTTYDNRCFADAAEVSIDHDGPCEEEQVCGAAGDAPCPTGSFCKREEGVCGEDARGVCATIPSSCPATIAKVCGCDGQTYNNACLAAAAGVTVASRGECGRACGGDTGVTCDVDEFCKNDASACAENAPGTCAQRPGECPATIHRVCGCDGETYDNACMAAAAGVNVASEGACGSSSACGGESGATCGEGQYCRANDNACTAGAAGVCTTRPDCCPPTSSPVCGCDNVTYTNDCAAAAAGVTVKSVGACTP